MHGHMKKKCVREVLVWILNSCSEILNGQHRCFNTVLCGISLLVTRPYDNSDLLQPTMMLVISILAR